MNPTTQNSTYDFKIVKEHIIDAFMDYTNDRWEYDNLGVSGVSHDTYYLDLYDKLNPWIPERFEEFLKIQIVEYSTHISVVCKLDHWEKSRYYSTEIYGSTSIELIQDSINVMVDNFTYNYV